MVIPITGIYIKNNTVTKSLYKEDKKKGIERGFTPKKMMEDEDLVCVKISIKYKYLHKYMCSVPIK